MQSMPHRRALPTLSVALAVACAIPAAGTLAHQDVEAPTVNVIGHYETGVGTSDAASEGGVTAKRIETRPLLRTGEVVELVPGMIVTQHSGDGKANQYFLRGYNLDHGTDFALWVDGMPVNMPTHGHGQGYADINFMIPELVSAIGFRKGPYFAEEGDFSSAGVARIRYFDRMDRSLASVTFGSHGYKRGVFANSTGIAQGNLLYALEAATIDGPWDNPEDLRKLNGVMRYTQGDAQSGFDVALMSYASRWNATDQIAQRAVDDGSLGRYAAIDPTDGGKTSRHSLSFSGRTPFAGGGLQADAYVIRYEFDLWSNFSYFLNDPVNGDQFKQTDRRTVYGFNPSYAFERHLFGKDSLFTVGMQSRHDAIGNVGLYTTRDRDILGTIRQDRVGQTSVGLYLTNSTQWLPWFRSLVGARADHYRFDVNSSVAANSGTRTDNLVSPKLSLIFGPWERTEFFANAGSGFHSNDARGTTIRVDPATGAPVDRVNPLVRTRGAELGMRTEILENIQTSVALWTLKQDSELLFVGDAGTTQASRPSRRSGVEWITYARPVDWLLIDAELALTRARFDDGDPNGVGNRIPGAIDRMATLGVTVDNIGPWFGALQLRHFGARPLIEDNTVRSQGTTIANARVGYTIDRNLRVHLDVLNLLGSRHDDITYYYASCLRSEVGVAPQCSGGAGGNTGIDDRHFHPVEPRQLRVTLIGRF